MVSAKRVYYRENNINKVPDLLYEYDTWNEAKEVLLEVQSFLSSPFCYELTWAVTPLDKSVVIVAYYIDNSDDLLLAKLSIQENELK